MHVCILILVCLMAWSHASHAAAKALRLDSEGCTVWRDCARRGAVTFCDNAQRDQGTFPRLNNFSRDPNVPARCQQTSTASSTHPMQRYDRGHLVPANHLDNSRTAITQRNDMTNILPQVAAMNRGAWLQTEAIVECYRDLDALLVLGGIIWGSNTDLR